MKCLLTIVIIFVVWQLLVLYHMIIFQVKIDIIPVWRVTNYSNSSYYTLTIVIIFIVWQLLFLYHRIIFQVIIVIIPVRRVTNYSNCSYYIYSLTSPCSLSQILVVISGASLLETSVFSSYRMRAWLGTPQ